LTLGEWVEEYLEAHQGERVTVAKLRWLLGKATAELGGVRLAELSPEQVCAWRLTVSEGHRFEATQALRQVLNRAVAWKLIDENPAKRGVPNPGRRCREQRPFESWAQIGSLAERLGPMFGPMVVFAAATGLRPSELFALEQGDLDRAAGVVQIRRAYANGRVKQTKTRLSRRAVPLQAIAEHRDDRPPLRSPRSRQLPARRLAPRRACARAGRGRWVDTGTETRKAARRHGFQASRKRLAAGGGRSVDAEATTGRDGSKRKGLISRNFAEPSDGLEPSTPSL
jgi:integrase